MMLYKATAYDPQVGAPRVWAVAESSAQAQIECYKELCKYLQSSHRWVKAGEFKVLVEEQDD